MKVLGLDTSTLTAGVAVLEADRGVLAEARHDSSPARPGSNLRSSDLLVTIDAVCRRAGVAPAALDAVAIGAGPGSFTGLRIGMATAKGIAFAAQRPLWAVSSLAALADDARHAISEDDHVIVAVLDARRGELFAGCFRGGAAVGAERVLAPHELAGWIAETAGPGPTTFAGDALAAHREVLAEFADRWSSVVTPSGAAVARLALAGPRVDVLADGAPSYIRASEAEIKYPDGVPGALRRR